MYFCTIPPDVISYIDYITYRIFVNLRGGPKNSNPIKFSVLCFVTHIPNLSHIS